MTFRDLQGALMEEVGVILKDMQSETADEKKSIGFHGYEQTLPVMRSNDDDEEKLFPFYIVRIAEGKTKDDDDCWHVSADVILAVHEMDGAGHQHILTAIQRIVDRFTERPALKGFRADQEITWQVGEEDGYPYCYGAVALTFSVPKISRRGAYV